MSVIKEESYSPSNLDTTAEYGIVDSQEKLCLHDVKPLDPNLHITSSSRHEGHNAFCVGSTGLNLSTITVKVENENADEKGCNLANHNASGPSPLISLHSGESDEFKCSTSNITSSTTIDQHKPISPVRKTINTENCINEEPCSSTNHFPIPNMDTIVIHSIIDDVVYENADLENDIAGKSLYSNGTPSMYSECKRVKNEPTIGFMAEHQSGSKKPTLEEMQISEIMSGKLIPKVIIQKLELNVCNIGGKLFNTKKTLKSIDPDNSSPRRKGSFTCRICLKNFCFYSAVKKHMIQKHPLSRDLCAFVQKEIKDSANDSQLVWFCPRNCKYFTSEYKALSEHLVTCQKPDLLPSPIMVENIDIGNNLGPLEFDNHNDYDGGTNADSLMAHTQPTGQTSSVPGQTVQQEMQTSVQILNDMPTLQLCDQVFSTNLLLEGHVKDCHKEQEESTHTGDKPCQCSYCDKRFNSRGNLNVHMRILTGEKLFQCSHCDKRFTRRGHLNVHMNIHTGEKPYQCSHCNKSYSDRTYLNRHMKMLTGEKPYQCSHCDKRFTCRGHLNAHMKIHIGEKPYKCSHCDKSFSHIGYLNEHFMTTHPGEKPYQCSHCDKRLNSRSNLNDHMRIHTGEKPYKCSHCDKSFSQSSHLNVHMRIHTGEKPYQCSHCDKRFTCRSYLNAHMRIHTGEKPYQCSHCDKRFTSRNQLNKHMRIHTGEKPFQCTQCDKRFTLSTHLNTHMRIHTGEKLYQCSQCDKRFTRRSDLNIHMRIHTGEKPYQCSHCNKSYRGRAHLNRHLRMLTGEKPYKCHCDKKYTSRAALKKHMRTHM